MHCVLLGNNNNKEHENGLNENKRKLEKDEEEERNQQTIVNNRYELFHFPAATSKPRQQLCRSWSVRRRPFGDEIISILHKQHL